MFINLKSLLYVWISISSVIGECSTIYQRKEIRSLSSDELQTYASAVKRLHSQIDPETGLSGLEKFSELHVKYSSQIHYHPLFFPWHRYFIREYEKALQEIDPSVYLPYWDWTLDASDPASSKVLSNEMFGSHGDYQSGSDCVIDGLFAGLNFTYPTKHCLQRHYDQDDSISPFASYEYINPYLNEVKFSDFSQPIEYPHGSPHSNIGGYSNDFWAMNSPNDPLFYLHHAFMDLLWYEWRERHPSSLQYDGDAYGEKVLSNQSLLTWDATVQDTLLVSSDNFCYSYPRYPSILAPDFKVQAFSPQAQNLSDSLSEDSSLSESSPNPIVSGELSKLPLEELMKKLKGNLKPPATFRSAFAQNPTQQKPLKKMKPLSDEWLKMNGFNLQKAKDQYNTQSEYLDLLNSIPNFVPFESLMKKN